jgi:transposase
MKPIPNKLKTIEVESIKFFKGVFSQYQLAKMYGVNRSTIYHHLKNKNRNRQICVDI